jgi:hypothetical protein
MMMLRRAQGLTRNQANSWAQTSCEASLKFLAFFTALFILGCFRAQVQEDTFIHLDATDSSVTDDIPVETQTPHFTPEVEGGKVIVSNGLLTLTYDLETSRFSIKETRGESIMFGARQEASWLLEDSEHTLGASNMRTQAFDWHWETNAFGSGLRVTFFVSERDATLKTSFFIPEAKESLFLHSEVALPKGAKVLEINPIVARGSEEGGLILGSGTSSAVVLDNGSDLYFDFVADHLEGRREKKPFSRAWLRIELERGDLHKVT